MVALFGGRLYYDDLDELTSVKLQELLRREIVRGYCAHNDAQAGGSLDSDAYLTWLNVITAGVLRGISLAEADPDELLRALEYVARCD